MNIYEQLQAVEDRYEELGELLSDPDVVSDTKRFMELSKEEASTRDTVAAYREYKRVLQNITDAEEMIKDATGDADLEEMAKQELKDAKAEKEEYEEKLKILLLPKDPNDDKNIILEIRGAAGGDEASLFAGDLLTMYQKYAESQGWKFEVMEASMNGVGGFKEVVAMVSGQSVYSKLKYESGAHRVQRVPVTECLKLKKWNMILIQKIFELTFITLLVLAVRMSTKLQQPFGSFICRQILRLKCRKNEPNKRIATKL